MLALIGKKVHVSRSYLILFTIFLPLWVCWLIHWRNPPTSQGRSQWGRGPMPPFNFQTKQTRSNSFSFKHQGYCFVQVFRNYTDQKFHDFYWVCYSNLRWFLIFSNYIGEIDHFTLDLLKRPNSQRWTFWKVSYCGPSKRRPQWTRV